MKVENIKIDLMGKSVGLERTTPVGQPSQYCPLKDNVEKDNPRVDFDI